MASRSDSSAEMSEKARSCVCFCSRRETSSAAQTPAPSAVFHSDFSTALGKSVEALTDADQPHPWEELLNNGNAMTVIPSTGLDFPTANVLQIDAVWRLGDPGANAANPRITGLPIPDQGESLFYRWFIRVMIPDEYTIDPLTHPIQDARNGGTTNWMFEVLPSPDGRWQVGINVNGGGVNAWPNNRWYLNTTLQKNRVYRFELALHRTGTATFRMQARIYDAAGNLLYDDADWANIDRSHTLADGTNLRFSDVSYLANFQCGLNGLSAGGPDDFPFVMYHQAAFEIRGDRWAGAQ